MATCLGGVALLVAPNSPLTNWVALGNAQFSEIFEEMWFLGPEMIKPLGTI